jgi:hypothetical protein
MQTAALLAAGRGLVVATALPSAATAFCAGIFLTPQ